MKQEHKQYYAGWKVWKKAVTAAQVKPEIKARTEAGFYIRIKSGIKAERGSAKETEVEAGK